MAETLCHNRLFALVNIVARISQTAIPPSIGPFRTRFFNILWVVDSASHCIWTPGFARFVACLAGAPPQPTCRICENHRRHQTIQARSRVGIAPNSTGFVLPVQIGALDTPIKKAVSACASIARGMPACRGGQAFEAPADPAESGEGFESGAWVPAARRQPTSRDMPSPSRPWRGQRIRIRMSS